MAMVDVSRVLTNPRFLTGLTVYRRKQKVNNFGEPKLEVEVLSNVQGVVYPASKNDLERYADAQITQRSIVILTQNSLRGESETIDGVEYQPDIVLWKGNHFLIVTVDAYTNYGRGFVKMIANSMDIVDLPTETKELTPVAPSASGQTGFGIAPFGEGPYGS
jgi:hypothetical protein